ncbi:MAG: hypothetical protein ABSC32_12680 [Steroidobacteraceae bacterium]
MPSRLYAYSCAAGMATVFRSVPEQPSALALSKLATSGQSKLPRSSPTVSPRSTNFAARVRRPWAITDSFTTAAWSEAFVIWVGGSSKFAVLETPMR